MDRNKIVGIISGLFGGRTGNMAIEKLFPIFDEKLCEEYPNKNKKIYYLLSNAEDDEYFVSVLGMLIKNHRLDETDRLVLKPVLKSLGLHLTEDMDLIKTDGHTVSSEKIYSTGDNYEVYKDIKGIISMG